METTTPTESRAALGEAGLARRTEHRTFPRFVLRISLFWLPILIVGVGGIEILLWRSGETWPISRVIQFQAAHPNRVFLRKHFGQDLYSYKWNTLMQKQPEVLVLGSSRVMKFRAEMFGLTSAPEKPAQFLNCGGLIQSTDDLESVVKMLPPTYTPKVAIIGVDMWWFNKNYRQTARVQQEATSDAVLDWRQHLECFKKLLTSRQEFQEALHASKLSGKAPGIGLGTLAGSGMGFRADGSIRGNHENLPIHDGVWRYIDSEKPPVKDRVNNQNKQFPPTDGLSKIHLEQLKRAILQLRRRGVFVIVILPPVADEIAALLTVSPGQQKIWAEYKTVLPDMFKQLDLPILDASTPSNLGLDDRYMADGFHGEETLHLHLIKKLIQNERVAMLFPRAASLVDKALSYSQTNYWFPRFD